MSNSLEEIAERLEPKLDLDTELVRRQQESRRIEILSQALNEAHSLGKSDTLAILEGLKKNAETLQRINKKMFPEAKENRNGMEAIKTLIASEIEKLKTI
jgi:hypothetical protein